MMGASLIFHLETSSVNMEHNYNWATSADYGGEGPNPEEDAHVEHYVYLAVRPLPRVHARTAASAPVHRAHDRGPPNLPLADELPRPRLYQPIGVMSRQ